MPFFPSSTVTVIGPPESGQTIFSLHPANADRIIIVPLEHTEILCLEMLFIGFPGANRFQVLPVGNRDSIPLGALARFHSQKPRLFRCQCKHPLPHLGITLIVRGRLRRKNYRIIRRLHCFVGLSWCSKHSSKILLALSTFIKRSAAISLRKTKIMKGHFKSKTTQFPCSSFVEYFLIQNLVSSIPTPAILILEKHCQHWFAGN